MKFTQAIKLALKSLLSNRIRSFLTMLGIIIGITSVIVLIALGDGSKQAVLETIQSMGTNLVTVSITGSNTTVNLSDAKIKKLVSEYASVENFVPMVTGSVTAKEGSESTTCTVQGSTSALEEVKDVHPVYGRFINDIDKANHFNVIDVGVKVLQALYPDMSVTQYKSLVGKSILLNGTSYEIVGILESKGTSSSGDNDNVVIMPITTAEYLLDTDTVSTYYAEAASQSQIDQAVSDLTEYFYPLCSYSTDNYTVLTQSDLLSTSTATTNNLTMMLVGIAAISLIVGGIGIMNIMMVSVIERTREIGIRKAIGAKRRDIMVQFLIEAVFLSCVGGILGVLAGILICVIVPLVSSQIMVMSGSVMLMAFSFSAAVGIIFGAYPAAKASKLRPIDALRYE